VDFVAIEHEVLDFWEQNQIFKKLIAQNANGPKWAFPDGPLTANNPWASTTPGGALIRIFFIVIKP
jgi:isoleucyl-tRNA synthetase